MVRAISMIVMGGGFLVISPKLREDVGFVTSAVTETLNNYSPFSYIVVAIGIVALLTLSLHNAGTKRT